MASRFHLQVLRLQRSTLRCGKDRYNDWCRVRFSLPHLFVNGVLRSYGFIESGIFDPCTPDITEVALLAAIAGETGTAGEGFDRDFIEALAAGFRGLTQDSVKDIWNIANRVLHAFIVGYAGMRCKH